MEKIRMEDMTWTDVKAGIDSGADTVVFGVGSTEQHGPSLPLKTDGRIADYTAGLIARELGEALKAPTIRVGHSHHHLGFSGTVSLRPATLTAVISDYIDSLASHGFRRMVITNHHGGNCSAIEQSLAQMAKKYPDIRFVYFYDQDTRAALGSLCAEFQLTPGQMGTHGGDMETSVMMYLDNHLVRKEYLVKGFTETFTPELREKAFLQGFESVTPTGVLGDQTRATPEKGQRYLEVLGKVILGYVKNALDAPAP